MLYHLIFHYPSILSILYNRVPFLTHFSSDSRKVFLSEEKSKVGMFAQNSNCYEMFKLNVFKLKLIRMKSTGRSQ